MCVEDRSPLGAFDQTMTNREKTRRRARASPRPRGGPDTISFRVDADMAAALAERADRLGISLHDVARELVRLGLQQVDGFGEVGRALEQIQETLTRLRGDVATTAEALLVTAGGQSQETAYHWVEQNLAGPCSRSPNR